MKTDERILELLKAERKLSLKQIAEKLNVKQSTVTMASQKLASENKISLNKVRIEKSFVTFATLSVLSGPSSNDQGVEPGSQGSTSKRELVKQAKQEAKGNKIIDMGIELGIINEEQGMIGLTNRFDRVIREITENYPEYYEISRKFETAFFRVIAMSIISYLNTEIKATDFKELTNLVIKLLLSKRK